MKRHFYFNILLYFNDRVRFHLIIFLRPETRVRKNNSFMSCPFCYFYLRNLTSLQDEAPFSVCLFYKFENLLSAGSLHKNSRDLIFFKQH